MSMRIYRKINPKEVQFSFVKVSVPNLLNILRKLKGFKAGGYDNIPTSMFKDCAEEIAAPLA